MDAFSCPRCFVTLNPFGVCLSCGWKPDYVAGPSDAGTREWRSRALAAEAALAEAERDKARLDWLERRMKHGIGVWRCGAGNIRLECGGPTGVKGPRTNGDTLRAAIDAAMRKDKEP